jgi:hypothetical protein
MWKRIGIVPAHPRSAISGAGMARLAEYLLGSSPLGIFHAMKRWKIAEE